MKCEQSPTSLAADLNSYISRSVAAHGGSTSAVNPGNRVPFSWPPHPESYGCHILASDWVSGEALEIGGERFAMEVADTPQGLFGRIPALWFEARASDVTQLKHKLILGVEPLLERQRLIALLLERPTRFSGHIRGLPALDLLKLLYCPDRDVSNDARREIETHASTGHFFPALVAVLQDNRHPYRRSAQWAALDLFEDLASFARNEEDWKTAVSTIKQFIWEAPDDYARATYKAGVVLGGHMRYDHGARALLDCLDAPSRIGRRSAIHGLYHLAEWAPEHREQIIQRVERTSREDSEPLLREYAMQMARDIERADTIHTEDVVFPDEA